MPDTLTDWTPTTWRSLPARQQPTYPDEGELARALAHLAQLPPLVTSSEIEALRAELAAAARGERFVLQGGDCAEEFAGCDSPTIAAKLKILLQMSLVLTHGTKQRIVRVGRFAGQYAKPRSADMETRDGVTLPSYRGDLVNGAAFTEEARTPDPWLMVRGYERSGLTLNFIRALIDGGFADLHHPERWNLTWVQQSPQAAEYEELVAKIGESIRFMETLGGGSLSELLRIDFFTSHEALHLMYEEAQTRQVPRRRGWYDLTTHMPWIGMRTAQIDGPHVEFVRGIRNPLGVKVGPSMAPADLTALLDVLDPGREPGRIMLIHRMGAAHVAEHLPPLLEAVRATEHPVVWCCDPMHGNTEKTAAGYKTRKFDSILAELQGAFDTHERVGTILGGVHFELTGDDVTECTGGASGLSDEDLKHAYKSQVDPRLNYEQALEMAMRVARRRRG